MPTVDFTKRVFKCQKGFLLLEALVNLAFVAVVGLLVFCSMSWLSKAQSSARVNMQATEVASSLLSSLQVAAQKGEFVPRGQGAVGHFQYRWSVLTEGQPSHFCWVKVSVTTPQGKEFEMLSGAVLR